MKRAKFLFFIFFLCCCATLAAQKKAPLEAYIFLNTECPISQAAVPAINSLVTKYNDLRFVSVFTGWDTKDQVEVFVKKYRLLSTIKHDKKHMLVDGWSVTTTPEVVLVNKKGFVLYRGLLDNSFAAPGQKRNGVTISYLDSAIRDYRVSGKIVLSYTTPVGCRIEPIR